MTKCTSTYTPGRGLVELNGPKAIDDVGYYSENTEVKIRKEPRTTILEFSDDHSTCRRSYVDTWKVYFLDFALLKEPYRGYGTREAPITLTPGSFSKLRLSITAAAETAATLYRSPVPSLPDSFRGRMAARRHLAPGRIVWFGQRLKVAPATTISSHKYRGLYLIQRGLPEQEDRINSSLIIAYPVCRGLSYYPANAPNSHADHQARHRNQIRPARHDLRHSPLLHLHSIRRQQRRHTRIHLPEWSGQPRQRQTARHARHTILRRHQLPLRTTHAARGSGKPGR